MIVISNNLPYLWKHKCIAIHTSFLQYKIISSHAWPIFVQQSIWIYSIIVCKFIRKHTDTGNRYRSKYYQLCVHIHRKQCQRVKHMKLPCWALAPGCVCVREMQKDLLHFPPAPRELCFRKCLHRRGAIAAVFTVKRQPLVLGF